MSGAGARRNGFTLIELLVVIAIMASVLALAAPRLLPMLLYTTHEGAARRLANYGTAAIAEAAFEKTALTFKFDFKTQEYWLERMPEPPADENEEEQDTLTGDKTKSKNGLPKDDAELKAMAQKELDNEVPEGGKRSKESLEVLDEQAKRMRETGQKRERSVTGARASRVKQDDRVLPASQREKNKKKIDPTAKKLEPVELKDTILGRTRLPEEITMVAASLGEKEFDKELIEFEIPPSGLEVEAKFWLMNQEGKTFVVTWDPATGRTRFEAGSGKEEGAGK